jgi:hypothetical protein
MMRKFAALITATQRIVTCTHALFHLLLDHAAECE